MVNNLPLPPVVYRLSKNNYAHPYLLDILDSYTALVSFLPRLKVVLVWP
jgi:hypothetical protein